jgi:hypothetical protein
MKYAWKAASGADPLVRFLASPTHCTLVYFVGSVRTLALQTDVQGLPKSVRPFAVGGDEAARIRIHEQRLASASSFLVRRKSPPHRAAPTRSPNKSIQLARAWHRARPIHGPLFSSPEPSLEASPGLSSCRLWLPRGAWIGQSKGPTGAILRRTPSPDDLGHFWPHYWPAAACLRGGPRSFFTGHHRHGVTVTVPYGNGQMVFDLSSQSSRLGWGPRICFWVKKNCARG